MILLPSIAHKKQNERNAFPYEKDAKSSRKEENKIKKSMFFACEFCNRDSGRALTNVFELCVAGNIARVDNFSLLFCFLTHSFMTLKYFPMPEENPIFAKRNPFWLLYLLYFDRSDTNGKHM